MNERTRTGRVPLSSRARAPRAPAPEPAAPAAEAPAPTGDADMDAAAAAATDPRVRVIANFIIYLNAFGPLRDWLMSEEEEAVAMEVVAAGVDAMVASLGRS